MPSLPLPTGLSLAGQSWLPEVALVLAIVVALALASHYLLHQAERLCAHTRNVWDDAVVHAAARPLRWLIGLVGLSMALEIIGKYHPAPLFEYLPSARHVVIITCLAWFLIGLIGRVSDNIVSLGVSAGEAVDRTTADALTKLLRLIVLVAAVLAILQTLGISTSGILAAGGIGGLAIGFAAKDILANFFGGLTIYLDRPFAVGEWIRSPDKDIEGTVEYISWRHTRIRRFNKNPLFVPNALFTTIAVENPSRMSHRRLRETIGLRYQDIDKMAAITHDAKAYLLAHPEIDSAETVIVTFNEFAGSSVNFFVLCYTKTTNWVRYHELKQAILLEVAAIVSRHGAEIAYPTRVVHMAPEVAS